MSAAVMRANMCTAGERPAAVPQPVTVAISRHVKPGRVAEYDAWLHEMTSLASRRPGYQGSTVLRPRHGGDHPEYTMVLHFDTEVHLRAWLDAPERQAMLEKVVDIAEEPAEEVIFEPGMEYWFTPHDQGVVTMRPPPRWKMVIVLTVVVFLMLQLLRHALLLPLSSALPLPVLQVLSAFLQVVLLTYLIMPRLTRLLAFWLQPQR